MLIRTALVGVAIALGSVAQSATRQAQAPALNLQSAAARPTWKTLFDGTLPDSWRGYRGAAIPEGWTIERGALVKEKPVADLVSKDEFGDFELEMEWKIGRAGNSGIFYRGTEEYEHIYWSAPEYQLLDDIDAVDNKTRLNCAGAVYAVYESPTGHLKPVGSWNQACMV